MTNGRSAIPRHRPGPWTTARARPARRSAGAVTSIPLRIVVLVLLGLATVLCASATAHAASSTDTVKVFVVPADGQTVTLRSIAFSTLKDRGRAGEIFDLNVGQAQPDGGTLNARDDQLQPGWILRLPADASGPDVRLARDTSQNDNDQNDTETGNDTAGDDANGNSTDPNDAGAATVAPQNGVTLPLQLVGAGLGAILLAFITVGIVARRRIAAMYSHVIGSLDTLREPMRMRRRLAERRTIAETFAADKEVVRRAYEALGDFGPRPGQPEQSVHALRVDHTGVTAWLTSTDTATEPWKNLDATRWRRPADAPSPRSRNGESPRLSAVPPCLVRAGLDEDGQPVFVDLSRLDGVLSVTGPLDVARQVLENLLTEIGHSWPDLPVTVLPARGGVPPVAIPPSLGDIVQIPEGAAASTAPEPDAAQGSVRAVAARRPVRGVAVMAGAPTEQQAVELKTLCNVGWSGLVCGEVDGAHWRWDVDSHGMLQIPVLGLRLTAPA